MKTIFVTLTLLFLFCDVDSDAQPTGSPVSQVRHHLMPVPALLEFQTGQLPVDPSFRVIVKGYTEARLEAAISRMLRRLEDRTGLEFARDPAGDSTQAALLVQCQTAGKTIPSVDEDESYSLQVSANQAVLNSPTVVGALRGMETFLQLLDADSKGYHIPQVNIQDKPRFVWRGLLIDSGRHFLPVEAVKRTLDGMAAVKFNVLHWHLTEDQGFRVESREFPKLHQMGSDGLYYTQDQMHEVVAYARERGIRVVPEFDMPGHTTSWFVGYPELASGPGPFQIGRKAGIYDNAMDPTREEVYRFIESFIGEMTTLFPDAYFHIGGDENNGKQWDANPKIQAFKKEKGFKDNHALQTYFNRRVLQILTKFGKKMVGWDEILQPDLPKDIVVQSWRGRDSLIQSAKLGYDSILSKGYYLDLMFPAADHYLVDPLPADSGLDDSQAKHIMGGEACMWGEWVGPETIDSRIWPRSAVVAERFWSPRTVTDVDDMYRRLSAISIQLEELGLTHETYVTKMLRRLARSNDVESLQTLLNVVEPVKKYERGKEHPSTMLTPLTRLIDTARPDAPARRKFAAMVDHLLSDTWNFQEHSGSLSLLFKQWHNVHSVSASMIDQSPILREAEPLFKDLAKLGAIGLETINYLVAGVPPSPEWRNEQLQWLEQAENPKAEVEFVVISSLRQLIIAAAELSQLKNLSPADWKSQIETTATKLNRKPVGD